MKGRQRTALEQRRVRAARVTILAALAFFTLLALWQCVDSFKTSQRYETWGRFLSLAFPGETQDASPCLGAHPGETQDATACLGAHPGETQEPSACAAPSAVTTCPLAINQAGIDFMDASDDLRILWYQSSFTVEQSRVLFERALVVQGWHNMSAEDEQLMSFHYPANGVAGGGSLVVSFYPLQEGCSILVESL